MLTQTVHVGIGKVGYQAALEQSPTQMHLKQSAGYPLGNVLFKHHHPHTMDEPAVEIKVREKSLGNLQVNRCMVMAVR